MIHKTGFLTLVILFITVFSVHAADYSIPRIDIQVTIMDDGIVEIRESRTYIFDGSFSWADYRLPKRGYSEIQNIRVTENDLTYINENNEQDGTFSVSEDDNSVIVKWNYSAQNETRTFTITYELTDAIITGPDWSEFFWNFAGAGRDKSNDLIIIDINYPNQVSSDSLYVWNRYQSDDLTSNLNDGRFNIRLRNISSKKDVEIRSVFPTSAFNGEVVSVTNPEFTLETAQQEEQEFQEELEQQAEKEAFYQLVTPGITLLLVLISIVGFLYFYRRYGKRHNTGTISDQETVVIPDSTPPALIGRLISMNNTSGNHLAATLFDLARRGWFSIEEKKQDKKGFFSTESTEFIIKISDNTPDESLQTMEQKIVDFAAKRIQAGNNTFSDIFKGTDSEVAKWFAQWKKIVKNEFDEKKWIDKESYTGVYWNLGFQFVLLLLAIWLFTQGGELAIAALIFSSLMMFFSFAIIRRSKEGEEMYRRWKAYLKGLKNADKRTIRMDTIDRHFIYGTALGLSKNQINTLIESNGQETTNIFPWIILAPESSRTPASVASSMSALAASGTSSFGGTSGGSGASAGSSGGGATGGAG